MNKQTIELVARAIRNSESWSSFWGYDDSEVFAQAAIQALSNAGMVIVPREVRRPMNTAPEEENIMVFFDGAETGYESFRKDGNWWVMDASNIAMCTEITLTPVYWQPLPVMMESDQ